MEMLRMISFSLFVQTDQYERYAAYHPWLGLGLGLGLLSRLARAGVVQTDQYERYAA